MFEAFLILIFIVTAIVTGQNLNDKFKNDNSPGDDAFFTNEISQSNRQGRCKFFFYIKKIINKIKFVFFV